MITAREALDLPSARLSESDAEATKKLLDEIDTFVRANMTRNGCVMRFSADRLNGAIAGELVRACRRAEWAGELVAMQAPSRINGGMVIVEYHLKLTPMNEAYEPVVKPPITLFSENKELS